ncbi:MAG: TIGR02281 family clan AA aspartic protease [Pseudomonadota bacterium]
MTQFMQDPFEQEVKERRKFGVAMQALAWIALLSFLTLYFGGVLERQRNPNQSVDSLVSAEGVKEVTLKRNRMGHYLATGTINGEPVVFLLDTGATGVAVPANLARRLDLPRGRTFTSNTANGRAESYETLLDEVALGAIKLRKVRASINPGLQMNEVLLGMSFLKYIEFSQRGSTLTLRQYPDN